MRIKMKINYLAIIAFLGVISAIACKSDTREIKTNKDSLSDSLKTEIPEIKMGNFYSDNSNKGNSVVLADSIIYYTVIKNPDPEDDWQKKCLARLDRKALANIIFNAIYNGRLTAYNFMTDAPMTIDEVKLLEKEHPRKEIAKMEFSEEWYFNENDLSFSKKVNAIMLGYEGRNLSGEVKYFAGVKVFLNGAKKKLEIKN